MSGKAFLFLKVFMFYLYILHSVTSDRYYVGYTNNPERRLREHNNKEFTTYTSKHRPLVLMAVYECGEMEADAIKIKRFIKKQKSRSLIEKLIQGCELVGILAQLVRVPHVRY
ncbi:MAG: GIY-YIG nuclease family protein [Pedobacter sp.]|nr:MAG: GIY-YIG nuclease family protein [Pedobacter sp.]